MSATSHVLSPSVRAGHVSVGEGGLSVATAPTPEVMVVRAVGEIDLSTVPGWGRALVAAREHLTQDGSAAARPEWPGGRRQLVCDLSGRVLERDGAVGAARDRAAGHGERGGAAAGDLTALPAALTDGRVEAMLHDALARDPGGMSTSRRWHRRPPRSGRPAHQATAGFDDAYLALRTAADHLPRPPATPEV